MIAIVILLLLVLYIYASDTFEHFIHAFRVASRMILVLCVVFLILGLIGYSFLKFGIVF